jgi:hypothetical protein
VNSIVVLGNGESRAAVDVHHLKKTYPLVGCNAIHRDIIVDHLICCDHRMVFESLENKNNISTKIYVRERFYRSFKKIQKNKNIYQLPEVPTTGTIKRDNPEHWGSGPYAVLVASLLDQDQIYLIGFDLYPSNDKFNNIYKGTKNYNNIDSAPVDPSYWIYQMSETFKHYNHKQYIIVNYKDWKIPKEWQLMNVSFLEMENFKKNIQGLDLQLNIV